MSGKGIQITPSELAGVRALNGRHINKDLDTSPFCLEHD